MAKLTVGLQGPTKRVSSLSSLNFEKEIIVSIPPSCKPARISGEGGPQRTFLVETSTNG